MNNIEDFKFVFNISLLKPGDILLINSYESQRRLMPNCIYDHAAIYIDDSFLIEADGTGVVMEQICSYAFKDDKDGCILRVKDANSKITSDAIFEARKLLGMDFSSSEARKVNRLKDSKTIDNSNRAFCSRLVSQVYHKAGIDIVYNPNFCAPDDFLNSKYLLKIEPSLMSLTNDMISTVQNAKRNKENHEWNDTLAELFQNMGHFYQCDIQTMEQLIKCAIENPNKDEGAVKLLNEQKWMCAPLYQIQKSWPWFKNDSEFCNHFDSTKTIMFFLNNQLFHYDNNYLPSIRDNKMKFFVLHQQYQNSKIIEAIYNQIGKVLDEALEVRKRLTYLYSEEQKKDERGFKDFCSKYGTYDLKDKPTDISRILFDILKNGTDTPINNQNK